MNALSFSADNLQGQPVDLKQYLGKVVLIVNTASECGLTPQYQGLEQLYREFHKQGLEVLGFPCNQFGQQEPGNAAEIGSFCEKNFGVSFPLFAKIEVNGPNAHPLYQYLIAQSGNEAIAWNFAKFLIKKDGNIYQRYNPQITPEDMTADIQALLAN